jgi:sulfoacetaldehyde dehydrogenase
MPMTMSLGCSTWGGNSVSHNVNWKDLLNYTYVSKEIASTEPSDEALFDTHIIEANA